MYLELSQLFEQYFQEARGLVFGKPQFIHYGLRGFSIPNHRANCLGQEVSVLQP